MIWTCSTITASSQGITALRLSELRQLGWLKQNYNIILMGPYGTGKTFIASRLVYHVKYRRKIELSVTNVYLYDIRCPFLIRS